MLLVAGDLDQLVYAVDPRTTHPRWVVSPSPDKHATYATLAICEDIAAIPCLDEDCGPDGAPDPALLDILPPARNAGEEAAPRVTDLAALGSRRRGRLGPPGLLRRRRLLRPGARQAARRPVRQRRVHLSEKTARALPRGARQPPSGLRKGSVCRPGRNRASVPEE